MALRKTCRETGRLRDHPGLLRFWYVCLNAPSDERLAALASELVQLKVDVIVAGDSRAIPPAQHATSTIPIVMTVSGNPVAQGYVTSLARPGGNITGLANLTTQLVRKRLELLTEAVPGVSRVAALGPTGPQLAIRIGQSWL
jgi:ABC-type uncharacterized transport system substrate-binding protein